MVSAEFNTPLPHFSFTAFRSIEHRLKIFLSFPCFCMLCTIQFKSMIMKTPVKPLRVWPRPRKGHRDPGVLLPTRLYATALTWTTLRATPKNTCPSSRALKRLMRQNPEHRYQNRVSKRNRKQEKKNANASSKLLD